ncbi:MAG: DUF2490 domain-containing protein [Reichenbachiella sp.]
MKILIMNAFMLLAIYSLAQNTNPASQSTITERQIWLDFYPHFAITKKLRYYGDLGFRSTMGDQTWFRLYMRPSVQYRLNDLWQINGGVGFFWIQYDEKFDRFELTPWQGIRLNWPNLGSLKFRNRIRLEERFSKILNESSTSFDLRMRYKLSGMWRFAKKSESKFWFAEAFGELFFPLRDEIDEFFRNRTRFGFGLGHSFSNEWRVSILMNWQNSRFTPEDDLNVSDRALQLKIWKRWKSKSFDSN